jgi:WhiB family redox-sensing transcriptional regulator
MRHLVAVSTPAGPAPDWRIRGACSGQADLFFGPDDERAAERRKRERMAQEVCAGCPVRRPCLLAALAAGAEYGVWGGVPQRELRKLLPGDSPRVPVVRADPRLAAARERVQAGAKRCARCEMTKPLDDFGVASAKADGRTARCRDCMRDYQRDYHDRRKETAA